MDAVGHACVPRCAQQHHSQAAGVSARAAAPTPTTLALWCPMAPNTAAEAAREGLARPQGSMGVECCSSWLDLRTSVWACIRWQAFSPSSLSVPQLPVDAAAPYLIGRVGCLQPPDPCCPDQRIRVDPISAAQTWMSLDCRISSLGASGTTCRRHADEPPMVSSRSTKLCSLSQNLTGVFLPQCLICRGLQ